MTREKLQRLPHWTYTIKMVAEAFMREYYDGANDCSCEHGHLDCSTYEGGPCMDEVLTNFPELIED